MAINGKSAASGFVSYNCPIMNAIINHFIYLNIKYIRLPFLILIPSYFYLNVTSWVKLALLFK